MPLVVTPSQLQQRAELYHQLGSLLSAGVGLVSAVEMLQKNPPDRSLRVQLAQLQVYLDEGDPFTVAVRKIKGWIPEFDIALMEAGEQSGKMDAGFKLLAVYYRERALMVRNVISDLLYPVFVFHFAVVLFPFIDFFKNSNLALFVLKVLGVLVPLYLGTFLLILACQGKRGEAWRSVLERILHNVPVLGRARRHLALARMAVSLEALIDAGVPVIGGWELAAKASGSPALYRRVMSWKTRLESGSMPSELISAAPEFPELFANLYHSGEASGRIDETLKRLYQHYQEEGSRKLRAFAKWVPLLIYFGIMLLVGYKIVSFYSGYFNQMNFDL